MNTPIQLHDLSIGLALSGGGVRASVFHMGILARLATDHLLENIAFISTVSGGTLVTGLIYASAGYRWPSSDLFLSHCQNEIKYYLTCMDLQLDMIVNALARPHELRRGRAHILSDRMQERWGITGSLNEIPLEPRWILNATTYETGRNFRFIPQRRMGDYLLGYVKNPDIPLADAMAASAGFPSLIGPLVLEISDHKWFKYEGKVEVPVTPPFDKVHLWDGGLYDNLGIEPLFKIKDSELRKGLNFLIVSDASQGITQRKYSRVPAKRALRLIDIAMEQIRALRSRTVVDHFTRNNHSGVYLKMGNSGATILEQAGIPSHTIDKTTLSSLDDNKVMAAVNFPTTLKQLSGSEYELLFQHGWEVADHTLHSRCAPLFQHVPYNRAGMI